MNMMKKFLALGAALVIGTLSVFAQSMDDMSYIDKIGSEPRDEFLAEIESIGSLADFMFDNLESQGLNVNDLYEITMDEADEEDLDAWESTNAVVASKAKKNDVYLGMIIRGIDMNSGEVDGWIVFSHFLNKNDIDSYLFYFAASVY